MPADARRVAISFTAVIEETDDDCHAVRAATYSLSSYQDVRHLDIKVLGIVPRKTPVPNPGSPVAGPESVSGSALDSQL
jgi:hypothetical protein